eukprot:RCo026985
MFGRELIAYKEGLGVRVVSAAHEQFGSPCFWRTLGCGLGLLAVIVVAVNWGLATCVRNPSVNWGLTTGSGVAHSGANGGGGNRMAELRILLVTLEFADPVFSGNGVYSRSLVASLTRQNHTVMVVCGTVASSEVSGGTTPEPPKQGDQEGKEDEEATKKPRNPGNAHQVIALPLSKWYRLDKDSAWKEFAQVVGSAGPTVAAFAPQVVLAVDWSGVAAAKALARSLPARCVRVFMNFRVYFASAGLADSPQDREFYTTQELSSIEWATATVTLTKQDLRLLQRAHPGLFRSGVLLPPLRQEIHLIASSVVALGDPPPPRKYLVCCVRLSAEKNALLFAEVVVLLGEFLASEGLQPLLCGSDSADPAYAAQ